MRRADRGGMEVPILGRKDDMDALTSGSTVSFINQTTLLMRYRQKYYSSM